MFAQIFLSTNISESGSLNSRNNIYIRFFPSLQYSVERKNQHEMKFYSFHSFCYFCRFQVSNFVMKIGDSYPNKRPHQQNDDN